MIPKKIHYCWFGRGEKSKLALKCIESWKKYCPDYQIIEWNEDNFDINMNGYTCYTYEHKKYAFLSDYVRLLVVEQEGGIYFDVDVEVVKSFNELLKDDAFLGFETNEYINTGMGFGAVAGNDVIRKMIAEYDDLLDGTNDVIGCPVLNTTALVKLGLELNGELQKLENVMVYPSDYFNPLNSLTGKITITSNTYSIHRYAMSWLDKKAIRKNRIARIIKRVFGENCLNALKR